MEIIKVVAFAFVALAVTLVFKGKRDDIAVSVSMIAGILIFIFMIPRITAVMQILQQFALKAKVDFVYLTTVLKILGIAYIASFCSEICKDAGQNSIASRVEFSGKILILMLAVPILMGVLNAILNII
ncbi:stage III sporulation protein AD [Clostridium acetobutylicum]|uniref:Stage III sporulation protein AD, SpoIIIAD n=1 Tax=Clostridium acetobutylicum (strain ATCC 824 / DSM 792 / JCM 1419 / IAM 19013 / LMG 5710 / NBRC 13948 / NRRL B-527 / VKM B-1787 / 2291 / W) TaxID=272562 RepID=Q97HC2_CLOAB|nr:MULTISPECIES: stage III sporulation protein AD [Clostridium]AAK80049.1 Stage III sporulation protein AD, SpoIIIAD [Clostridium acetobutylicum ATCC 824]ADZ21141.1 Stage III sporulation protein AD, SpoIIIAD [Clostridium acetobutylicum EA 2018]AEI33345.1 stage III sporulation protein AD, SpoIIIAD [Clostridium acetobutylicum DSM 1731]AWV79523.1 stage III sporulation protein AD [Clostridium acetobutylicum]KHD38238.1 stage III sporulation protein AD [Clostridium acetobutylicum]